MINKVEILQGVFSKSDEDSLKQILQRVVEQIKQLAQHQSWFSRKLGFSIPKGLQIAACEIAKNYGITISEKNLAKISYLLVTAADKDPSSIEEIDNKLKDLKFSEDSQVGYERKYSSSTDLDKIYQVVDSVLQRNNTGYFASVIHECETGYNKTHYTNYRLFNVSLYADAILFKNIIRLPLKQITYVQLNELFTNNEQYGCLALYALGVSQQPPVIPYTQESISELLKKVGNNIDQLAIDQLLEQITFAADISQTLLKLYSGQLNNDKEIKLLVSNDIPLPVVIRAGTSKIAFYIKFKDGTAKGFAAFRKLEDVDVQLNVENDYATAISNLKPDLKDKMNQQSSVTTFYSHGICTFSYHPDTHKSILSYLSAIPDSSDRKTAAREINCQLYMLMLNNLEANLQHGDLHINNLIMVNESGKWLLKQINFGHRRSKEMVRFDNVLVDFCYMLQARENFELLNLLRNEGLIENECVDKYFPDEEILIMAGYYKNELSQLSSAKQKLWLDIEPLWSTELAKNESPAEAKILFKDRVKSLVSNFLQEEYPVQTITTTDLFSPFNHGMESSQKISVRKISAIKFSELNTYTNLNLDCYEHTVLRSKLKRNSEIIADNFTGSIFSNTLNNAWLKICLLEKGCNLKLVEDSKFIVVTKADNMVTEDKLILAADVFLKEKLVPMPLLVRYIQVLKSGSTLENELISTHDKLIELLQSVVNDDDYLELFLASAYFIHNQGPVKTITDNGWNVFRGGVKPLINNPKVKWSGNNLILRGKMKFPVINFLPDNIINSMFSSQAEGAHKNFVTTFDTDNCLLVAKDKHGISDFIQEVYVMKYTENNPELKRIISLQNYIPHSVIAQVDSTGTILHKYIEQISESELNINQKCDIAKALIKHYLTGIQLLNKYGISHYDPHGKNSKVLHNEQHSVLELQFFDFGNSKCIDQQGFDPLADICYYTNNNYYKVLQQRFSGDKKRCRRMVIADIFYLIIGDYKTAYDKFKFCCGSDQCLGLFYQKVTKYFKNDDEPSLASEYIAECYSQLIASLGQILDSLAMDTPA